MKHYNITIDDNKIVDIQAVRNHYDWADFTCVNPSCSGEYIISIADDCGDNVLYYTTVATWHSGLRAWIKDNEVIADSIVQYWAELPQPYRR